MRASADLGLDVLPSLARPFLCPCRRNGHVCAHVCPPRPQLVLWSTGISDNSVKNRLKCAPCTPILTDAASVLSSLLRIHQVACQRVTSLPGPRWEATRRARFPHMVRGGCSSQRTFQRFKEQRIHDPECCQGVGPSGCSPTPAAPARLTPLSWSVAARAPVRLRPSLPSRLSLAGRGPGGVCRCQLSLCPQVPSAAVC